MNKSDLRNFAINARLELLRRVRERAVFYGVDEKSCAAGGFVPSDRFQRPDGAPLSAVEIAQRDALLRRVRERGYAQTMEEAAYTWFNRFAALRYMQAHNRLPISVRVLPDSPGGRRAGAPQGGGDAGGESHPAGRGHYPDSHMEGRRVPPPGGHACQSQE